MSSSPTMPKHLEADLEHVYRRLLVSAPHRLIEGVDDMTSYPPPVLSRDNTWTTAVDDHQDPVAHLEHDEDARSDFTDELGRHILPMPTLTNPNGPADLMPDPVDVASRPVSPMRFTREEKDKAIERDEIVDSEDDGSIAFSESTVLRRVADINAKDAGFSAIGPLKVDQKARERFRARLRAALEIVVDETKPLTLGSLLTVVDEITELDARMTLIERTVRADQSSTRHLIGLTAKSEANASESRMQAEVAVLRRQIDVWRAQVPLVPGPAPLPVMPQAVVTQRQVPTIQRGYRRG